MVVGLVADDEITREKGSPPVMPYAERRAMLAACKWVDEIVEYVEVGCVCGVFDAALG